MNTIFIIKINTTLSNNFTRYKWPEIVKKVYFKSISGPSFYNCSKIVNNGQKSKLSWGQINEYIVFFLGSTSSIVTCQAAVRKSSSVQTNQTNPNSLQGSIFGTTLTTSVQNSRENVVQIELRLIPSRQNSAVDV